MRTEETGSSVRSRSDDDWNPEGITQRFVGFLKCNRTTCGEIVAVCGDVFLEPETSYDPDGQPSLDYVDVFVPKYFHPAPPIFVIAPSCPADVAEQLNSAFALIWADTASSANRMRVAVELLLNERKVQKTRQDKSGKWRPIPLHDRVLDFQKKSPDAAELLLAIKWLGNTGSHEKFDSLSRSDILDGLELFEHAINLVYVQKESRLKLLAKGINKRKGPLRRPPYRK